MSLETFIQLITHFHRDASSKNALGTSTPPENVELVLKKFEIENLFYLIGDATQLENGKPLLLPDLPDLFETNMQCFLQVSQLLQFRRGN